MFSQKIKRERREAVICTTLLTRLKESVQSVLQPGSGGTRGYGGRPPTTLGPMLGHSDNTNALCSVLEAIMIHGLRDSFGERLSSFLGPDPDRMPVPNFWPVILVISHKDLIQQVNELTFITSEVGRGRAWLRLALNQGQVCSYLGVLLQDSRTLKDYYRPTAFLRDSERGDLLLGVLQPVATLTFSLATNAAVLNTWTQSPLILAGLWVPSSQSGSVCDPVLAGTDVVSTVHDDPPTGLPIPTASTPLSDQMFDMIVGGTPETSFISQAMEHQYQPPTTILNPQKSLVERCASPGKPQEEELPQQSESLSQPQEEKTEDQEAQNDLDLEVLLRDKQQLEASASSTVSSTVSYVREVSRDSLTHSIIEGAAEYDRLFSEFEAVVPFHPDFPGLQLPQPSLPVIEDSSESSPSSDMAEKLDFEVVPHQSSCQEDMDRLLPLLTRLTTEEGLDAQEYRCHQCQAHVGMIYGKPRLCGYDSRYYCYECHEEELMMVPARVVYNWDFTPYPVCTTTARWLATVHHRPLLDIRIINPKLYNHIDDLSELQVLRMQLLYLRAYLFTCRSEAGERLRHLLWPREHIYQHVHLYSVADLQLVSSGQLVVVVREAVTMCRAHVKDCEVCRPRGFICELCDNSDIIYPFQLDDTHTCGVCYVVTHAACARGRKQCPRCARRAARNLTTSTP